MVRIHEWKTFENRARDVFAKNPLKTRYSFKHNVKSAETDGVLKKKVVVVIKVTDDTETITYKTNEKAVVKRLTKLNKWFAVKMSTTEEEQLKEEAVLKARLIP